jgi:hypothetical protein
MTRRAVHPVPDGVHVGEVQGEGGDDVGMLRQAGNGEASKEERLGTSQRVLVSAAIAPVIVELAEALERLGFGRDVGRCPRMPEGVLGTRHGEAEGVTAVAQARTLAEERGEAAQEAGLLARIRGAGDDCKIGPKGIAPDERPGTAGNAVEQALELFAISVGGHGQGGCRDG